MKLTSKRLKQMIKRELKEMMSYNRDDDQRSKNAFMMHHLNNVLNGITAIPVDQKAQIESSVKNYTRNADFPQTFDNALEMALNDTVPELPSELKGMIMQQVRSQSGE